MNKYHIYSTDEMVAEEFYTTDFEPMDKPGEYIGRLVMRGSSKRGFIRLFFVLKDGRKIITPVFKWQRFLGFMDIPNGTIMKLTYEMGRDDKTYLKKAEKIEPPGFVLASTEFGGPNSNFREHPETPGYRK